MTTHKIVFVGLFAFFAAAQSWAAGETTLELVYERKLQDEPKQGQPSTAAQAQVSAYDAQIRARGGKCTVVVDTPNDVRRNKETLGATFGDKAFLTKPAATTWLETALLDLKEHGFNAVSGKGNPSGSFNAILSTDLDKFYLWAHSLNLYATLVVKAKFKTNNGTTLEKKYRVNGTKLNWWGADSEFVETINITAGRLLDQIAEDLDGVCGSKISS